MLISQDGDFSVVSLDEQKILITDGTNTWVLSAKTQAKSTAVSVSRGEDEDISLTVGDITLDLSPKKVDPTQLLVCLTKVVKAYGELERKCQETEQNQASLKSEQLKLRRQLTSSIPMEDPESKGGSGGSKKTGGSLLNPNRPKLRKKTSHDPFGDDDQD